jgi:hypothetical protein
VEDASGLFANFYQTPKGNLNMKFVIKIKNTSNIGCDVYVADWSNGNTPRTFKLRNTKFFDSVESAEEYIKAIKLIYKADKDNDYEVELV